MKLAVRMRSGCGEDFELPDVEKYSFVNNTLYVRMLDASIGTRTIFHVEDIIELGDVRIAHLSVCCPKCATSFSVDERGATMNNWSVKPVTTAVQPFVPFCPKQDGSGEKALAAAEAFVDRHLLRIEPMNEADVKCICGRQARLRVTGMGKPNAGRQFFVCDNNSSLQCPFFIWKDDFDKNPAVVYAENIRKAKAKQERKEAERATAAANMILAATSGNTTLNNHTFTK